MILKNFDINKKINFYLLYGSNNGLISETINKKIKPFFTKNIYQYDEKDILENINDFKESVLHKSLFDDDKFIIVNRATDKILTLVEEIVETKIDGIKIVLKSGTLEKKSKLRKFFEKNIETVVIPFYQDNKQTILNLIDIFFKKKKIRVSQQIVNLIATRSRGDRINLYNELNKINSFAYSNQTLSLDSIKKLTNLSKEYDVAELADQCLAKNKSNTINILNESKLMEENCIIFIRSFLFKLKRLKKFKTDILKEKNIEKLISNYKPPIFWKDKEIIIKQFKAWNLLEINSLIKEINQLEILIKKNTKFSSLMINSFIYNRMSINNIF